MNRNDAGLTAADRSGDIGQKARPIGGDELIREMRPHAFWAETAQVDVEVAIDRHELADFDTGGEAAVAQPVGRLETGRVVVAGDIEPAQSLPVTGSGGRGGVEGGEVIGRECRDHRQLGQDRFEREHRLDALAGDEDPRLRGGRLVCAETHAIAEQVAESAARVGDRRLVGPISIEPGALDAGDPAAGIGDGGKQCRPRFERCLIGFAVPDPRMKAQRDPIEASGNAAGTQIGFGLCTGDRTAGGEQTAGSIR